VSVENLYSIFKGEFVAPWVVIQTAKEHVATYDDVELRKNTWHSLNASLCA
jgi:hypothetical protein